MLRWYPSIWILSFSKISFQILNNYIKCWGGNHLHNTCNFFSASQSWKIVILLTVDLVLVVDNLIDCTQNRRYISLKHRNILYKTGTTDTFTCQAIVINDITRTIQVQVRRKKSSLCFSHHQDRYRYLTCTSFP